ncbi:arabinan endo-1,5-alpha-L-arabinosidase [Kribbella monticola]|uniref:arabinan endo-1,5-alpha-L-arabinosidase n=1 Tax=Kribbella monticola TaxID=2185285 RepID=UPI000DD3FCD0|nr:arabinan endo-1,5-alpha-L-arabinosidase [Kribbella monticola]
MRRFQALLGCLLLLGVLTAAPSANAGPGGGELTGDLTAHDPALIRDGGQWYVFSTGDERIAGGTIELRKSGDGRQWSFAGTVFDRIPSWLSSEVPGVSNLWAPEVVKHGNTFYLYYAASTFGSNRSVIALATNTTLDPGNPAYRWVDRGLVQRSATTDDYNAIDPGVITDGQGTPWLAFGSFWSGIRMIRLQWPSGLAAPNQGTPLRLADRRVPPNAIEAPYVVSRGGWYYLFVSFDFCCRGTESTYKIAVGRSRSVTGPYSDQAGKPMLEGGGTVILSSAGRKIGPGGQSVSGNWLAHHYYDADANGAVRFDIRQLSWGSDGWPSIR